MNSLPSTAAAAPGGRIVVNSLADVVANDGSCTLREAIVAANSDRASITLAGEGAAGPGSNEAHKVQSQVKDGATKDTVIAALEARIAELEAAPAP